MTSYTVWFYRKACYHNAFDMQNHHEQVVCKRLLLENRQIEMLDMADDIL